MNKCNLIRSIYKYFFLPFLFSMILFCGYAQGIFKDSMVIIMGQAEKIFFANNLSLLSEKYNLDATRALILQARLLNNPQISINQAVYNTEFRTNGGREWFDYPDKGETSAEIQKLFLLAGKRNKKSIRL